MGYSNIPKPEQSLVLFRNGYMPHIPRGDQIVPLEAVPSKLQLLLQGLPPTADRHAFNHLTISNLPWSQTEFCNVKHT